MFRLYSRYILEVSCESPIGGSHGSKLILSAKNAVGPTGDTQNLA